MARPKKQGIDYFSFDVDFFQDEKIVAIAGEFGIKGEITAVKLLCAIYRNGYYIEWTEMLRAKLLHSLPSVSASLLDDIVSRLVRWGFFDKSMFDTSRILTSIGIQKRYFSAVKRRITDNTFPHLLVSVYTNEVYVNNNPVNVCRNAQSKVNNKKETMSLKKVSSSPTIIFEELKADTQWAEVVRMKYHLSHEEFTQRLNDFHTHCISYGKEHLNETDAKSHFCDWLRIQQTRGTPTKSAISAQNRQAETLRQAEQERKDREREEWRRRAVTPEQLKQLRARASAGDPEAIKLLNTPPQ